MCYTVPMRGPRIAYPNAVYHVINRFVDKHPFFRSDADYRSFLAVYQEVAEAFGVITYAYALMPNHFHFLIETPQPNISAFLQRFLSHAVPQLNRRSGRTGHLMQGRSKTLLVQSESYFITAFEYVLTNPMRSGLAPRITGYPWSSADDMLNKEPQLVDRDLLAQRLWPNEQRRGGRLIARLEKLLAGIDADEVEKRFAAAHRGPFLGDEAFRRRVLKQVERRKQQGSGLRRRQDRPKSPYTYAQVVQAVRAVLDAEPELNGLWRSPDLARRDLQWYVMYQHAGWKWAQLVVAERNAGMSRSVFSMVVSRMRRDEPKRHAVECVLRHLSLTAT